MGVHGDGYKDIMEEDGTYGSAGVMSDRGEWYSQCIGCVEGLFLGVGIFSSAASIGMVDGLHVWVEIWE